MPPEHLPIVAIVGRPNVGKSRLFNRYAGARRALVDDQPGVTRDRISQEIELSGRRFLLVDTAGLEPDPTTGLEAAVQAQAETAVEQADAILFVVDGRAGLLPEDEAIARTLRRSDKPVALAVNKIDQVQHAVLANEFHRLGLEAITAISAEHGAGCFDALEGLVALLPAQRPEATRTSAPGEIRVAIVGRPNVGKSSLTNRLLGEERVVVSNEPGTTRDRIEARLEQDGAVYVFTDTAGLRKPGRRGRVAERGSALMTVRSLESADVALLVIDASEGLADQDAHVAAEICERGCSVVVLANKWDLVPKDADEPGASKRVILQIEHGLRFLPDALVVPVSALTGSRVRKILPAIRQAAEARTRRIATPELNRWLQQVVQMHAPAADRRSGRARAIRFLYATQTSVRPPTFVFFCNEPQGVQASYRRFLENKLREAFDFRGTPIRLRMRARARSGRDGDRPRPPSGPGPKGTKKSTKKSTKKAKGSAQRRGR